MPWSYGFSRHWDSIQGYFWLVADLLLGVCCSCRITRCSDGVMCGKSSLACQERKNCSS
nr:hypothetical protein Iba_chr03aCG20580 [Ipomoea batatas]GMC74872.1 hypothetical protein Iba_chr03cCG14200 [Ipomoea batatas]GMC76087.1 hypothetical protein Iba_chr03dCG10960 [Ipomoea batatas]GMC77522.1 hypothetical protein Iba_chr03eCG11520 [Ipomoea batatas]GMC78196.1 hypothetical protein Iba_chr03fCG5670 [Ipomoea batatas]